MTRDEADKLARTIRAVVYTAYCNTLRGPALPMDIETNRRMKEPRAGDLVCEISTIWQENRAIDATGYLESITWEPVDFGDPDFIWDTEAEGRPHPTEKVFNIVTLDGRPYRWVNATFVASPDKPFKTPV